MERKEQKREVRRSCRYFVYCFDFDYVYVGGRVMKEARKGMKVRIVEHKDLNDRQRTYLGQTGIVVDNSRFLPAIRFKDGKKIDYRIEELEEVKDFTKDDLKDGIKVVYRNGEESYFINNSLYGYKNTKLFKSIYPDGFSQYLKFSYNDDYDIMKVYDRGELVWEREEVIEVGFDEMEEWECSGEKPVYAREGLRYYKYETVLMLWYPCMKEWIPSEHNGTDELKELRFVKVVE